eukprot:TRINITY_DN4523_c0_g1_i3.p1 TRINITY_DN4523_c0_g1~~TRINITY_DN4523_c0_g1_i3.p1  ORF type:complete len:429 (-),score=58.90 TRINITY_DN4523_c0_g1_i3:157-1443(-)
MTCVDVVVLWVDGSDPWHANALAEVKQKYGYQVLSGPSRTHSLSTLPQSKNNLPVPLPIQRDNVGAHRFRDNQELKYCLRSIYTHAPWVRMIHIVTSGKQIPKFLTLSHPRINIVPDHKLFLNKSHLPTFNSDAIQMHIHRIPNLAPKFLFFDDDNFFGRATSLEFFYSNQSTLLMTAINPEAKIDPKPSPRDNFQWQALRYSSQMLSKYGKSTPSDAQPHFYYPSHVPFLAHRELYREVLDVLFKNEADECSSQQIRKEGKLAMRLIAPEFLRLRRPRSFDLSYVYSSLLDVDEDGFLNLNEIHAMVEFTGRPQTWVEKHLCELERLDLVLISENPDLMEALIDGWNRLEKSYSRWRIISPATSNLTKFFQIFSLRTVDPIFTQINNTSPILFCLNDNLIDFQLEKIRERLLRWMNVLYPTPAEFEL